MKYIFLIMIAAMLVFTENCHADNIDDLIKEAEQNMLSKSKRATTSGKRILREKVDRLNAIDIELPGVINGKNYAKAESLLRESAVLTIQYFNTLNNLSVAEKLTNLGMVYYNYMGKPNEAKNAFIKALNIAIPILGEKNVQLSGIYSHLAVIYFEEGNIAESRRIAEILLDIYIDNFGPQSPQTHKVKSLLKEIYKKP
ncbi:MAG: tetratricopeptide repeat protein [Candidatus Omnitrophica bacterium]|nr:tetratricopeptide repeat protein [Candidatus Omnitrophota bacterium]